MHPPSTLSLSPLTRPSLHPRSTPPPPSSFARVGTAPEGRCHNGRRGRLGHGAEGQLPPSRRGDSLPPSGWAPLPEAAWGGPIDLSAPLFVIFSPLSSFSSVSLIFFFVPSAGFIFCLHQAGELALPSGRAASARTSQARPTDGRPSRQRSPSAAASGPRSYPPPHPHTLSPATWVTFYMLSYTTDKFRVS